MLDPSEKLVFDGMMSRLRDQDPFFLRKINKLGRPRRKMRLALAILLWTIAPFCVVFGGWTGLLMGAVAVGYGAFLANKRGRSTPVAWWPPTKRRPEAPSL